MHYEGKNQGKKGKGSSYFHNKQTWCYFSGPQPLCKISWDCGRTSDDRQTDRWTDRRKWFDNLSHAVL